MANQTSSIVYHHPYATLLWTHKAHTAEDWQDATLLSGYVSGQGTKTLELSSATPDESGYLRCVATGPDGQQTTSSYAVLGGEAGGVITFVDHPVSLTLTESTPPMPAPNWVTHPTSLELTETP